MTVRARATVLETDGRRVLFQVEASDEVEKIAEGRHERFIVSDLAPLPRPRGAEDPAARRLSGCQEWRTAPRAYAESCVARTAKSTSALPTTLERRAQRGGIASKRSFSAERVEANARSSHGIASRATHSTRSFSWHTVIVPPSTRARYTTMTSGVPG